MKDVWMFRCGQSVSVLVYSGDVRGREGEKQGEKRIHYCVSPLDGGKEVLATGDLFFYF